MSESPRTTDYRAQGYTMVCGIDVSYGILVLTYFKGDSSCRTCVKPAARYLHYRTRQCLDVMGRDARSGRRTLALRASLYDTGLIGDCLLHITPYLIRFPFGVQRLQCQHRLFWPCTWCGRHIRNSGLDAGSI